MTKKYYQQSREKLEHDIRTLQIHVAILDLLWDEQKPDSIFRKDQVKTPRKKSGKKAPQRKTRNRAGKGSNLPSSKSKTKRG
jgi:hypothetical protein